MRIIVTGAAGLIGYHLCRRLLDEPHQVIGIDNFSTGQRSNTEQLGHAGGFHLLEHDICQPVCLDGPVDLIYNLACPPSPVDFASRPLEILRTCSDGVRQMLELACDKQAVFLQASTSECYGDPLVTPQPETYWGNVNPIGPRSCYDEGKRFAEALTMSYHRQRGLATRIVRIFNTYGPRMRADDGRALPTFINQALRGEPLTVFGDGSQTRSFCYVDDLVDGIVRLAQSDVVEPVNIGSQEEVTIGEVAREVIELTCSQSTIEYRPLPQDDPKVRRPDNTRARQLLGWQPVTDRRMGFARTIEHFRSRL
ncbi:MAG TPA: UDP-glucuronic acid decarboxylase family protein [Phycisphaerae bacterium]|nr:UDP-glucuronic acid decarboxylase family protein [Phycisphaerae bacterium]